MTNYYFRDNGLQLHAAKVWRLCTSNRLVLTDAAGKPAEPVRYLSCLVISRPQREQNKIRQDEDEQVQKGGTALAAKLPAKFVDSRNDVYSERTSRILQYNNRTSFTVINFNTNSQQIKKLSCSEKLHHVLHCIEMSISNHAGYKQLPSCHIKMSSKCTAEISFLFNGNNCEWSILHQLVYRPLSGELPTWACQCHKTRHKVLDLQLCSTLHVICCICRYIGHALVLQ